MEWMGGSFGKFCGNWVEWGVVVWDGWKVVVCGRFYDGARGD